jgi:hypothetical protein
MVGTIHSIRTKVAEFSVSGVVRTRILQTIIAVMLSLNYRNNFKRLAEVIDCNENTVQQLDEANRLKSFRVQYKFD